MVKPYSEPLPVLPEALTNPVNTAILSFPVSSNCFKAPFPYREAGGWVWSPEANGLLSGPSPPASEQVQTCLPPWGLNQSQLRQVVNRSLCGSSLLKRKSIDL